MRAALRSALQDVDLLLCEVGLHRRYLQPAYQCQGLHRSKVTPMRRVNPPLMELTMAQA
jgi:hypothetical protein